MITIEQYAQINNKSIKVYKNVVPQMYYIGMVYSLELYNESKIVPFDPPTHKVFHTTKPISTIYSMNILEDGISIYVPYNLIADAIRKDLTAKT